MLGQRRSEQKKVFRFSLSIIGKRSTLDNTKCTRTFWQSDTVGEVIEFDGCDSSLTEIEKKRLERLINKVPIRRQNARAVGVRDGLSLCVSRPRSAFPAKEAQDEEVVLTKSDFSSEIASNHFTSCFYVALCCPQHGEIRAAMQEAPVDRFHPCPLCHLECEYALLGWGGTHVLCQAL